MAAVHPVTFDYPTYTWMEAIQTSASFLVQKIPSLLFSGAKSLASYTWQLLYPTPPGSLERYQEKVATVQEEFRRRMDQGEITMGGRASTHLFRPMSGSSNRIDLSSLNQVVSIDPVAKTAVVEGMTSFYDLVDATFELGLIPKVVPELGGITVGGAIAGLAVESSSFKQGLFHRSLLEMEVLTADGEVRTISRERDPDLFYGMPNALGTLGYVLSAKIELAEAKPYVRLEHIRPRDVESYFKKIEQLARNKEGIDFLDGAIFSPDEMTITVGRFVDSAPFENEYCFSGVYYEQMRDPEMETDYLPTKEYLWRWDHDVFWNTPDLLRMPWLRRLLGARFMRSENLMRINKQILEFREKVVEPFKRNDRERFEPITQDVGIPIERCAEFVEWLDQRIGIYPLFICPIESPNREEFYPLWDLNGGNLACDVGFFNGRRSTAPYGSYNREVEAKVEEEGGKKSLYSRCFFTEEEFYERYNGAGYQELKEKWDPEGRFPHLYEKVRPRAL